MKKLMFILSVIVVLATACQKEHGIYTSVKQAYHDHAIYVGQSYWDFHLVMSEPIDHETVNYPLWIWKDYYEDGYVIFSLIGDSWKTIKVKEIVVYDE